MVITVVVGLSFIGLGFLVKKFPNLIAGYNDMSDEKKKRANIDGLSSHMRNSLIAIGGIIVAGSILLSYEGRAASEYQAHFPMSVILIGTFYMWIRSRTYIH